MELLIQKIEPVFAWLLQSSWQASVLIVLVLLVQKFFKKQLSAKWRYTLWFLVIARMMMPALPESSFSIFNLAQAAKIFSIQPGGGRGSVPAEPLIESQRFSSLTVDGLAKPVVSKQTASTRPFTEESNPSSWKWQTILSLLWLGGALFFLSRNLYGTYRLSRKISDTRPLTDASILNLFEDCKTEMNVKAPISLVKTELIESPALMGLIRPRLLLPAQVIENFNQQELRYVFLHELAHIKRGDVAINWLVTILQASHWFNPVVWFGFSRMRLDREPACDALVLSQMEGEENQNYGSMIIKLLENTMKQELLPSVVGILEDKKQIKERLQLIVRFTKASYWQSILAIVLLLSLGVLTLTAAKNQNQPTENNVSQKIDVPVITINSGKRKYGTIHLENATAIQLLDFYQKLTKKRLIREANLTLTQDVNITTVDDVTEAEAIRMIEEGLRYAGIALVPGEDNVVKVVQTNPTSKNQKIEEVTTAEKDNTRSEKTTNTEHSIKDSPHDGRGGDGGGAGGGKGGNGGGSRNDQLVRRSLYTIFNQKSKEFDRLKDEAENGDMLSQYCLGQLFEGAISLSLSRIRPELDGLTAPIDRSESIKWYTTAAEQGHLDSQKALYRIFVDNSRISGLKGANYEEAFKWIHKAAEQEDIEAHRQLAGLYRKGIGTTKNMEEAINWYRKAAEQGDSHAIYELGTMYQEGTDITLDYKEAVKWYQNAAERGHVLSQYCLAWLYAQGKGMAQDYVEAYKWFDIASANSNGDSNTPVSAANDRDKLAALMTPEQIAEAKRRSAAVYFGVKAEENSDKNK